DTLPRLPTDVIEKTDAAIVRRYHQGLPPPLGVAVELYAHLGVPGLVAKDSKGGDDAFGVVHQAVQVDRNEIRRLERSEIGRVSHPATGKIPTAFRRRAGVAIESLAQTVRNRFTHLVIRAVRLRSRSRQ